MLSLSILSQFVSLHQFMIWSSALLLKNNVDMVGCVYKMYVLLEYRYVELFVGLHCGGNLFRPD